MTETQTRVQTRTTEQDFFAGYNPVAPTTDRIQAPEFMPYSFDVSAPVETPYTQEYQAPSFEVEKGYSFDTSSYEPVHRTMATPSIQRNTEIIAHEDETRLQSRTYAKAKLNARGKIMITMYSIIVAIIVALCIYNAVAINGLNSDIAYKEGVVASQMHDIEILQSEFDYMGTDVAIEQAVIDKGLQLEVATEEDIVRINGFEMAERTSTKSESNWFEEFCKAIRKLFS